MLLQEINAICKKYTLLNQKTGGYFNIFDIANISTDEVIICRVIYELLSPTGSHYQETSYLKLFVEHVLHIKMNESELAAARVFREYVIDGKRRIDIVIQTPNKFIPIEVKIFAIDQAAQCFDYYNVSKNSNVYYLTRFGGAPSECSARGLTKAENGFEEVTCISFAEDILNWLELCEAQISTLKVAPIREIILQLMSVIRRFTNQMEDDETMEIKELLMRSSEHMRSAVAIENNIIEAKKALMLKLFKAIESKINVPKLVNQYDYEVDNLKKINEFYRYNKSSYPGISYLYKSDVKKNTDVWVRIEIDWRIYIGYCCPVNHHKKGQPLTDKEITRLLSLTPCVDEWWAYWEFIPCNDETACPDFKGLNEPYIKLFDETTFNDFVITCTDKINEFLNR